MINHDPKLHIYYPNMSHPISSEPPSEGHHPLFGSVSAAPIHPSPITYIRTCSVKWMYCGVYFGNSLVARHVFCNVSATMLHRESPLTSRSRFNHGGVSYRLHRAPVMINTTRIFRVSARYFTDLRLVAERRVTQRYNYRMPNLGFAISLTINRQADITNCL